MGEGPDFFVSYASPDRAWAEWIAWQLEAEDHRVVVQAWDFTGDWVHQMQTAVATATRVIAVLSPAYLDSAHAEAEWRAFYASDPDGSRGRLVPVRVAPVDPPGLLSTRVYVDLVGRTAAHARAALLAAVSGVRGKPSAEPDFPGTGAPPFPGGPLPVDETIDVLRAGDAPALRTLVNRLSERLARHGFSRDEVDALRVSLRELVDNVAAHVGAGTLVTVEVTDEPRSWPQNHEGMFLTVTDTGPGFDLDEVLRTHEIRLGDAGVEHGLLRAYRLGSMLAQITLEPHAMGWGRERAPQVPSTFGGEHVVPFVFSYRDEALRIGSSVQTFLQLYQFLDRSPAFLDLVLDPLLRSDRPYVGIEVVGHGWTGAPSWTRVLDRLLAFLQRNPRPGTELVAFADTGPSDQRNLREYCAQHGIPLFEDAATVADLRPADVRRRAGRAAQ